MTTTGEEVASDGLGGSAQTRLLIVDDHGMFAESLRLALSAEDDLEVVGTATTLAQGPPGFVEAVGSALTDPRFEGATVGLAVWVEGAGMVVNHNGDLAMRPGSVEKLLVAWGAYGVIGPSATLTTEVTSSPTATPAASTRPTGSCIPTQDEEVSSTCTRSSVLAAARRRCPSATS